MASTYAGTASDEVLTRAAVIDGVANGDLFWSGSAPWSSSGRAVTWVEFNDYVDMYAGAPDTNQCPAKADIEEYRDNHTAPTETPGTPSLSSGLGGLMTATWTNTTSKWEIDIEWDCTTSGIYDESTTRPAGSTSGTYNPGDTHPSPISGQSFRARVRYTNAYGDGAWTAYSNTVTGVTW